MSSNHCNEHSKAKNNNNDNEVYPSIHIFDLNKYKYNESKKISSSQSINQLNNKINLYLPQTFKKSD